MDHRPYQLFIIYQFLILQTSSCPEHCSPCISGDLYCDKQGLLEIPKLKNFSPQRAVLQHQQFIIPILSASNFSHYRTITDLSIKTCNINRVRPYTLSELSRLRNVDFSDNMELFIENNAFARLNLQFLKLDNVGIIKLDLQAFNGLSVNSLSIQNSNLLSLPAELMEPLSNSLINLYLRNNQLRSLDVRLRPVLLGLKNLELQENPFHCNCSLLWLSEILESKRHMMKVQPFENQEDPYPKCVAPPDLRKEYVYTLVNKLKTCLPPTIVQIDVVFHSLATVGLYCYVKELENTNEQTEIGWFPSSNNFTQHGDWKKSIQVSLTSSLSKYKCKAQNALGNSEIDLFLTWSETERVNSIVENNTFKFDDNQRKTSFLWEKVFSLFEMICAIFGTLVITVILFFLFCCCYIERNQFLLLGKSKRKLQTKNYPFYEQGIYSDARVYCETDMDICPFPPPPPPTPPPLPDTRLIPKKKFQNM